MTQETPRIASSKLKDYQKFAGFADCADIFKARFGFNI